MSVGHFADDDRLDDGADRPDEALRFQPDAGLVRAIRRRSWLGGSLAATELAGWGSNSSAIQSVAHYVALLIAIAIGLDLTWALLLRCYRAISGKVYILDMRGTDQRELRDGRAIPNQPRPRPGRRE